MNNTIPYIVPGDTISIIAPAKAIEKEHVMFAKDFFESKGYTVLIGNHCLGKLNYFSATDYERAQDFQMVIDNTSVKAIICARGGYGSVRIVDTIQWASQLRDPKWIVGFSDITVFHQHMQKMELPSIHATMPLNFQENSPESLQTLLDALEGKSFQIKIDSHPLNKMGDVEAELIGGNLSIVYSLIGTDSQPDYRNKILFIEEVGEQLYAVDRMFYSLKKSGILDQITGLIIGGMTDIKDTTTDGIDLSIQDIILPHFAYRKIPICFDFPAGHVPDNRALLFGKKALLSIGNEVTLTQNI